MLKLRDLVLFNIAAVTSMRWFGAAAHAGPISLVLWVVAAVCFFLPSALAVSELSRRYPAEGGFYVWTRECFGEWHAYLAAYCYILSNLFYFGSLALAIASAVALIFEVRAADDLLYGFSLICIWGATGVAIRGGRLAKWIGNTAAACTCAAAAGLFAAGAFAGKSHAVLEAPPFELASLNLWSQMAFAFVGLELGAVLAREIRDPQRTIPAAASISGLAITAFYLLGTAALLSLLHPDDVSPITGLIQGFDRAGATLDSRWIGPVGGAVVALAMTGQLGAWISGNGRLPFVLGLDRYVPPVFARLHPRWGTPWVSLAAQSAVASLFGLALIAGETARAGYQLLVDLAVLTAFLPYLYIFLAAWKVGLRWAAVSGFAVTLLAIALSLVPPADVSSVMLFEVKVIGGCAFLIGLGWLNFLYAKRQF